MTKKAPDNRDLEVGHRVRAFRLQRGLSQENLGDELGLTFQQIQKYEKGKNRIGAGRLQRIAEILGVSIDQFFTTGKAEKSSPDELFEFLNTSASLRLLRAYSRIRDSRQQHAVVQLVETLVRD